MNGLVELYRKTYGGQTKEAKGTKNMPPEVKAKFEANKKNPPGPAGGPGHGSEKKAAEVKLAEFKGGKVASASFFDELEKLNAADVAQMERASMREDSLVQKIRGLS
jgi:hypothetical protein